MGSKIEIFAKIFIFYHPKNAVFGSLWFLNISKIKKFLVICVEQTIWNISIYSLSIFRGILIYYMCKQLVYWHIFAHNFAFFENFINLFDFYMDFFLLKSLLGVGASSLNVAWTCSFDSWSYMFEIINEGGGRACKKWKIRLSAEIFRLRPWIFEL